MTDFDPEFDHVYRLQKQGAIQDEAELHYVPTAEHSAEHDVLLDGVPRRESDPWHALIDHSGQYRYHGAVMHASEQWGQWAIDDLMENVMDDDDVRAILFTVVEVSGHDDDDPVFPEEPDYCERSGCAHEPAGWAVLYRTI